MCVSVCACVWVVAMCVCVCMCVCGWGGGGGGGGWKTMKLRKDIKTAHSLNSHNTLPLLFVVQTLPSPSRKGSRVVFVKILTHGNDRGRDDSHDKGGHDHQEETKGSQPERIDCNLREGGIFDDILATTTHRTCSHGCVFSSSFMHRLGMSSPVPDLLHFQFL